jgi:L-ascorbate metabolism protein UlaG (beta-lactamase superfamily)
MRLTKFEHACLLIEDADARILIDPGAYSHGFESLTDLTAILVTHQHADHIDLNRIGGIAGRNPQAQIFADDATAALLSERGLTATAVTEGDRLDVGTEVTVHGINHAVIHPDIPVIPNVGYLVSGRLFHPGDAYTVPTVPVDVLCLPSGAPWLKVWEAADFLRRVAPRVAVPIHEAVLAMPGMHYGLFERLALDGTTVKVVAPGKTVTV